jgi:MFS family permease
MRNSLIAASWLNLTMMITGLSVLAVPVMAPAIALELGVSTKMVGTYTALMWSASVATSMAAGFLVGRFGALRVSQLCIAACVAGLLFGCLGSLEFLAASAVMIGLGLGAETAASTTLLARITPAHNRPMVFSFKQTGGQIGGMLAGVVYPALLPWLGWRGALLAIVPAIAAVALMLEFPRRRFDSRAARTGGAKGITFIQALCLLASDPHLLRLTIVCISYVAVHVCLNTFLVSYLVAERGLSLAASGSLLAVSLCGGLLGRVIWGVLSGRLFHPIVVLGVVGVGMLVCAGTLGLFGTRLPVPLLALLCFVFGITAAGWPGVHIAETARQVPQESIGQITGTMLMVGTAGLILGPIVFEALASATSFGTSFVMTAGCALVGLTALVIGPRRKKLA